MTTTDKDAVGAAITPETLAEWRKVAEAATQELWRVAFGGGRIHALPEAFVETTRECMVCRFEDYENDEDNAQHIATACPPNFLALLDRIAALEARCKAAEEELSADTFAAENENLRRALIRSIAGRYPIISAALASAEKAERAEATTAPASEGDDDAAFVEKQWRKVLSAWTVIDKERIIALARLGAQTPATPYDLLCRVDVLLHDAINDPSLSEDVRWHANEAHRLVHDAVAHLSPEADIRQQARSEAAARVREGAVVMIDVSNDAYLARMAIVEAAAFVSAPHARMRPRIYPDGDMWCCLYGDDIASGVVGFGETPEAACAAFDKAWGSELTPAALEAAAKVRGQS